MFKNWSEVLQSNEWARFAYHWKRALLTRGRDHGFVSETETETLLTDAINRMVEKNQHKVAFHRRQPWLITFDGQVWASLLGPTN